MFLHSPSKKDINLANNALRKALQSYTMYYSLQMHPNFLSYPNLLSIYPEDTLTVEPNKPKPVVKTAKAPYTKFVTLSIPTSPC